MNRSYQNWTVRGYMRPAMDWSPEGEYFPLHYREPVVVALDPRGWEWHVTLTEDRRHVATLSIHTSRKEGIDQHAMRLVPLATLRDLAATYLDHVEQARDEGISLHDALLLADREPGEVRTGREPPSPEDFAEQWRQTRARRFTPGGQREPVRKQLADHYGVTVWSIDKWVRRARDAGLLPAARTTKKEKRDD